MNEAELIKKCKNGDRNAFGELVTMYQSKVVNMSYSLLSNREDAFDAAQEVFLRVYRGLDNFREKSSFSTWIYRITTNVCSDFLRKRQRTLSTISVSGAYDDDEDKELEIRDSAPTPEEYAQANEKQRAVMRALSEIKHEYREIITLFDIEGMNYEEISDVLKIPTGTVKSRLNRARGAMRKKLSENMELFE